MRILVCSKFYRPSQAIGAVRWSNLADELSARGHEVLVLSSSPSTTGLSPVPNLQIHHSWWGRWILSLLERFSRKGPDGMGDPGSPGPGPGPAILAQIRRSMRYLADLLLAVDWALQARARTASRPGFSAPDVVISSYGPLDSLLAGFAVSRRYRRARWVSDLRDNLCNEAYPLWLNGLYRALQRRMFRSSDAVWVVSRGQAFTLAQALGPKHQVQGKVEVLTNGFPTRLWGREIPEIRPSNLLVIAYTGQLYDGRRDLSMLLEAVRRLNREDRSGGSGAVVHYAGPSSAVFLDAVAHHDLKGMAVDHGDLPHPEALTLQAASDLLVVLSWNSRTEQGILTGKLYEYMTVRKPLLCLVSGEVPGAELSGIVVDLRLGLACEYARLAEDRERLFRFLQEALQQKGTRGRLSFDPDEGRIREYGYDRLAGVAERYLEQVAAPRGTPS